MTRAGMAHTKRLSSVLGINIFVLFLIFSLTGLLWTYRTTNQLVSRQLADAFQQRHTIISNILSHQEELLFYTLQGVRENKLLADFEILNDQRTAEADLLDIIGTATDFPLDILFLVTPDDVVVANASSPFFNSEPVLPMIIKRKMSLLSKGKLLHLQNSGTDLTVQVRAVSLLNEKSGKVMGTLFGGVVFNDNITLLKKMGRETKSKAILLLSGNSYLGSTERKESETAGIMLKSNIETNKAPLPLPNYLTRASENLILSPRMPLSDDDSADLQVVFAIESEILSDIKNSYMAKAITLLAGATLFMGLIIFYVRSLTYTPLKHLLKYSDDISSGRMGSNYEPGKIKEFNQLGRAIESMVLGLQRANRQLQRDVMARTRAEIALKESEAHLRTVVETIPDLVWLKDETGVYLSCNKRFEQLFGATQEEIVGKTDYDFVAKDLADFFRQHDKNAMAAGGPCMNEEQVTFASDGHREYLETIKTPMFTDSGNLVGVLGIARDITDRVEAEKERKRLESQLMQSHKMEAIGTMAGGIAHDFNNILAAILGYTEMAKHDIPEFNPARQSLEQVLKAGTRAKELVSHILSFSRVSDQNRNHSYLDMAKITDEVLSFQRSILPSTISIETDIEPHCGSVFGNPIQLHQVLMNLCSNAYQAMESGGILRVGLKRVELSTEDLQDEMRIEPGTYVLLSVSDSGAGISGKIIDRIFDPYFTTKEVGKGTGMGLAVVIGIVKNHRGFVRVKSEINQGSTFEVYFPSEEDAAVIEGKSDEMEIPRGSERILFVDDEKMIADLGKARLEGLGYKVTAVESSEDALRVFEGDPDGFDLVITDQTMPRLAGSDLSQKILMIRPEMPIILCTGYSSIMDEVRAQKIGIKEYVMKPYRTEEIARVIRKVMDGYRISNRQLMQ